MCGWQRDHRKRGVQCSGGDPGRTRSRYDGTGFLGQAKKSSCVCDEDLQPHQVQLHAHGFLTAAVRNYSKIGTVQWAKVSYSTHPFWILRKNLKGPLISLISPSGLFRHF